MPTLRQIIANALDVPSDSLALPVDWLDVADKKLLLSVTINDGSNEQLASDKVNILLELLMEDRGLTLDEAEALITSTLKNLVEDTR